MKQEPPASPKGVLFQVGTIWIPVVAWMGIIYFLSSLPSVPGPPDPWFNFLLKKGLHFSGYAMLAVLWWRALRSLPYGWCQNKTTQWRVVLIALLLTCFYAISDEYHQSLVPGRNAQVYDVLIDSGGAVAGLLAIRSWTETKT